MLSHERRRSLERKAEALAANVEEALSYLASRGISEDLAERFKLGCVPKGEEYAGRLSIPYLTRGGVVSIKYRCIQNHDCKHLGCPKYLAESGTGYHLYNVGALLGAQFVVVTEGEVDAISVESLGIRAVGYPGTQNWDRHFSLCFEGVHDVVVLADGDEVGRRSAATVAERIGTGVARVVDLGDGYDANSFILEHGAERFIEKVA